MLGSDEKTPKDQFDVPWKDILEAYFPDFLEFFLPEAHEDIDWHRQFEFLDTEFARISRDADIGDRRMDKLVKVWRCNGMECWVLIHIEIQGNRKPDFASGMYVYQYRAYDLYQMPVVGLAILADEEVGWRPTEFVYELWGTKQSYQFTAIKLLDYSEVDLEQCSNPFAIVTLAHLHAKKTRNRTEDRYQAKRMLIRGLHQRGFNGQQVIDLFHFIDWVMHLPKELDDRLNKELIQFEESQKMRYISSMERYLEEQVRKKEGASILTRLLQHRFGSIPEWAIDKIAQAEPPSLAEWTLRILDATTLDGVFADRR
ncbi:MAG: DUF4351 domain-containing protein [Magnetococcus sp. YQC-5]